MITKDRKVTYEQLTPDERSACDYCVDMVMQGLALYGIDPATDDRAEALTGAMARYITDCRRETPDVPA